MPELTEKQKACMLLLGSPDDGSTSHVVEREVIGELLDLGLLYMRGPDHVDFTEEGDRVYKQLGGKAGYWD